jgi:hypothetical protein
MANAPADLYNAINSSAIQTYNRNFILAGADADSAGAVC